MRDLVCILLLLLRQEATELAWVEAHADLLLHRRIVLLACGTCEGPTVTADVGNAVDGTADSKHGPHTMSAVGADDIAEQPNRAIMETG